MATDLESTELSIQFDPEKTFREMSIHAQEIDLNELNEMDSLHPDDSTSLIDDKDNPNLTCLPSVNDCFDLDDILPEESFSTHVSPATSLVDGVAQRKPAISLFTNRPITLDTENGLPSPPPTAVAPSRLKDDIPCRFSDVEDSPPLRAAGFVGREIPTLDSDGEWEPLPTLANMPTRYAVDHLAGADDESNNIQIGEEKKKKKKKNRKKAKGV
jgi:hypothetical protein